MKKQVKQKLKQIIATILIVVIWVTTTDVSAFATETAGQNAWDGKTRQSVYEGENYRVVYTLSEYWEGGYNANISIENTGNSVIENWSLDFNLSDTITGIWNATIYLHEDAEYIIKNADWNQDIEIGSSVQFGFSVNENFSGFPQEYNLLSEEVETAAEDYTVRYELQSDWQNGFVAAFYITNNSDETIEDWVFDFYYDRNITSIWNGEIELQDGNHYIVKNVTYNSDIAPGQTVAFGFSGLLGKCEDEPYDYKMSQYKIVRSYSVTFVPGADDVTNIPKNQRVKDGMYATRPEYPERNGCVFLGWYKDEAFTEYFDFENTIVNGHITLYARWFDYTNQNDTDGDGVVDPLEEIIGSNVSSSDTDGDGLTDYIEINTVYTDPTKQDTDGNSVLDGCEDYDGDGLSNLEEIKLGTDLTVADTDSDSLSDYDEGIYKTLPLVTDTDGDGVSDGFEIKLGTDPLVCQDKFKLSMSSSNDGKVKAGVDIELDGNQVETLDIQVVNNEIFFPDTIPGYIGEAYEFSVDGAFEKACLKFEFSQELVGTNNFDPVVYYFNESEQKLEALETTVNGNVASAVTTHFSKYILINRYVYESAFEWEDEWSVDGYIGVELVIVIDDSGSMATCDSSNRRLSVARDLIDNLPGNSKIGIVKFTETISVLTPTLTTDKANAKSYLTTKYFNSVGDTYMYTAIEEGLNLYETNDENTLKMMVVLSDGYATDVSSHKFVVKAAGGCGVRVYTVGLGNSSSYFTEYLKPLAVNTGGTFYYASDAGKLKEIYNEINRKIDMETDSDSDGISDYYEEHMPMFNGVKLKMDKNNPDTDGDGLTDGEEVGEIVYEYNSDKTKVRVYCCLNSSPVSIDSDNDGLYDNMRRTVRGEVVAPIDPHKLIPDSVGGIWDKHVQEYDTGTIATKYNTKDWTIGEMTAFFQKSIIGDPVFKREMADFIVKVILLLRDPVNANESIIRPVALFIKYFCNSEAQTVAGAYLLNFVRDTDKVAYHSQVQTWQRYFGYNDFYDDVFRIGSFMHYVPIDFSTGSGSYRLWLWKGDYWNLHSGAEMGLYVYSDTYSETDQYDVINFELPMTLSLYYYYNKDNISNVFNWAPEENQWWITGFSGQNKEFLYPNRDLMVTIGTIDFTGKTRLYDALKEAYEDNESYYLTNYKVELIFDNTAHTVWVKWYEGVLLWDEQNVIYVC